MRPGRPLWALLGGGGLILLVALWPRRSTSPPEPAEPSSEPVASRAPTPPSQPRAPAPPSQPRAPSPAHATTPAPTSPPDTRATAPAALRPPATERDYWSHLEALERSDKERALAYALAGDEWYEAEGKPAEARRAKIVTLLVDLGRMQEARSRTRQFIEQYPNSPYRRLVQGVTGIHPRPGAPRRD